MPHKKSLQINININKKPKTINKITQKKNLIKSIINSFNIAKL